MPLEGGPQAICRRPHSWGTGGSLGSLVSQKALTPSKDHLPHMTAKGGGRREKWGERDFHLSGSQKLTVLVRAHAGFCSVSTQFPGDQRHNNRV